MCVCACVHVCQPKKTKSERQKLQTRAATLPYTTHIPVVQIDIDDSHADSIVLQRMAYRDRNIIQQAKSLPDVRILAEPAARDSIVAAVVTRRTHETEGVLVLPREHRVDSSHHRSRTLEGGRQRPGTADAPRPVMIPAAIAPPPWTKRSAPSTALAR